MGEHATTIAGEGKNPTKQHMLSVAETVGMSTKRSEQIISEIESCLKTISFLNIQR